MDDLTPEQRKKNMQHIRSKDTRIEKLLRSALWKAGIRYRKNYSEIPGKPDIAITKYKIAVFCDGEFFHGKNWNDGLEKKLSTSSNSSYWISKISKNIERDHTVESQLKVMGWTVLRFWGKDIEKHADECVNAVKEAIFESQEAIDDAGDWNDI